MRADWRVSATYIGSLTAIELKRPWRNRNRVMGLNYTKPGSCNLSNMQQSLRGRQGDLIYGES